MLGAGARGGDTPGVGRVLTGLAGARNVFTYPKGAEKPQCFPASRGTTVFIFFALFGPFVGVTGMAGLGW